MYRRHNTKIKAVNNTIIVLSPVHSILDSNTECTHIYWDKWYLSYNWDKRTNYKPPSRLTFPSLSPVFVSKFNKLYHTNLLTKIPMRVHDFQRVKEIHCEHVNGKLIWSWKIERNCIRYGARYEVIWSNRYGAGLLEVRGDPPCCGPLCRKSKVESETWV